MSEEIYRFTVEGVDTRTAGAGARRLADVLREVAGVNEVSREKEDPSTMDLGTIVGIVVSSGAALAIARGVADWLRRTRDVKLTISLDITSGSIKTEVERIDPATALRIVELVRGG